jgi:hypothetical protein
MNTRLNRAAQLHADLLDALLPRLDEVEVHLAMERLSSYSSVINKVQGEGAALVRDHGWWRRA